MWGRPIPSSLRLGNPKVSPVSAPAPQPPAPATPPGAAAQMQPNAQNAGLRSVSAAPGGSFMFDPPALKQARGFSTFTVNVMVSGGQNVYSVPVQLSYDPSQLQVLNVSNGGFLSQDGQAVALAFRDDPQREPRDNRVAASRSWRRVRSGCSGYADHDGEVARAVSACHHSGRLRDPAMQPIPMNGAEAAVTIQ